MNSRVLVCLCVHVRLQIDIVRFGVTVCKYVCACVCDCVCARAYAGVFVCVSSYVCACECVLVRMRVRKRQRVYSCIPSTRCVGAKGCALMCMQL